jgi:hypothetical protein
MEVPERMERGDQAGMAVVDAVTSNVELDGYA